MPEPSLSAASTAVLDSASSYTGYSPLDLADKDEAAPPTPRREKNTLKGAASQAWRDLKTTQWGRGGLWILFIIWLICLAGVLVCLVTIATTASRFHMDACRPDSTFSPIEEDFNYWGASSFFQISLAAGELSFTEVKVLDVAMQLLVGRGGQALLAFISWKAFRNYFTVKMAEDPITFATFFVIFLQPEPTFVATYRLIREFTLHRRPGSIATAIFIPLTVVFMLMFPTAVNSMTGYITVNRPFVTNIDGNMLPFSQFSQVAYIIKDGSRINETDDQIVIFQPNYPLMENNRFNDMCDGETGGDPYEPEGCDLLRAASRYTREYGFFGLLDEETTWMDDVKLEPPALDISAFYIPTNSHYFGAEWEDPRGDPNYPFTFRQNATWTADGELYDKLYMESNGMCQPTSETYKWGISYTQAFIMTIALIIWSLGASIMWLKGHRRLPLVDSKEVPCGWRAVIELARAMEAEFRAAGVDVTAATDDEVKREVRKRMRGGSISFREHQLSRGEGDLGPAIWAWLKREKWWVLMFLVSFIIALGFEVGLDFYNLHLRSVMAAVFWSIGGSVAAVLWLGSTLRSRLFMFSVLLSVVALPICTFVGIAFA